MSKENIRKVSVAAPPTDLVEETAEILRRGGLLALPSDTIYGLSCSAFDEPAVLKISMMKGHLGQRPFVVLFDGSADWLARLAPVRNEEAEKLCGRYWPGPLTMILDAGDGAPSAVISENGRIALRHPNHVLSLEILKAFGGPIVSTSANLIGETPLSSAAKIADTFGPHLDLILDAEEELDGMASTIVEATGSEVRLLRQGSLKLS